MGRSAALRRACGRAFYVGASAHVRQALSLPQWRSVQWLTRENAMYLSKSAVTMTMLAALALSSPVVFANAGGGGGGGARIHSGSGTRLLDQDRLTTRSPDRLHDRLQDRLYDRDLKLERDRDRIYGGNLMTSAERTSYEQQLRTLPTEQERVQFRMEHQHEMQQRAEQRHERLGPQPSESQVRTQEHARQQERAEIYGYSMMTPKEVARYQAQMGTAKTEQEREHIRAEHRQQMEERARERGVAPPQ